MQNANSFVIDYWKLNGADIIQMSDATAVSYEDFEVWWDKEVQRALKDTVGKTSSRLHHWMKRKEEEGWEGEDDKIE